MMMQFNRWAQQILLLAGSLVAAQVLAADVAYLAFSKTHWQVWVMDADGSHARQVTKSPYDKSSVSWYPDGKYLLVNGAQGELVKVNLSSGKEEKLALNMKSFADALLSPDGKQIAFSVDASDGSDDNNIWLIQSDGQNPRKLVDMAWLQHEPRWSRDGKWLYFLSGHGQQEHDIWKIDLANGNREQITSGHLYHFDVHPAPDGGVYFSNNRTGNYEIWHRDADGKETRVTDDPGFDASPALAPNGKTLMFESSRGGRTNLWEMTLADKTVKQVTQHELGSRKPVYFYGEAVK